MLKHLYKKLPASFRPLFYFFGMVVFILFIPVDFKAQDKSQMEKYQAGINFEQSGNYEKAIDVFLELLKQNPADNNYLLSLNRVLLNHKEYDLLIKILEERIKIIPADYNAYGLLGNAYYLKGEIEKAAAIWEKGLSAQPKSLAAYRTIASYAVQNRAYETAIGFYNKGEKEIGTKDLFVNEKFSLYNALQKYTEAAEILCAAMQFNAGYIGLGKSIIYSLTKRDDVCDKYIDVIKKYYAKSGLVVFKELLAFIYLAKGDDDSSITLMKEIDAGEKNGNTFFNFAQESFGNRNYHAASLAYKYLIENYKNAPFLMQARIYYPQSLEFQLKANENTKWRPETLPDTSNNSKYEKVVAAYEETVKYYPQTEYKNEALLKIGNIQKERLKRPDEAEKSFSRIIESNIYSASRISATENIAEIKLFNNKFDDAGKFLNEIINSSFADSLAKRKARFYLGKSYYWKGAFNEALENIDDAAYDFANDLSNDALELSALINACKKDSVQLAAYARADFLVFQRKYDEASEILKKVFQSENQILSDAARYRYGEILTILGKYPEALKIMKEISASDNSNYADNAYFSLGNIYYYGIKDFRSAKECFEKLLAAFPGSIYADESREMINTIKNKQENNNDNQPNK